MSGHLAIESLPQAHLNVYVWNDAFRIPPFFVFVFSTDMMGERDAAIDEFKRREQVIDVCACVRVFFLDCA